MPNPTEAEHRPHGIVHWDEPFVLLEKNNRHYSHVLVTCNICGKKRPVIVSDARRHKDAWCLPCHAKIHFGSLNNQRGREAKTYKGRRRKNSIGYMSVSVYPGEPFYEEMGTGSRLENGYVRYVLEHRYVMAMHLGRPLEVWEHVHHKDGDKLNNDLSNLEIVDGQIHAAITALQSENNQLRNEVSRLQKALDQLQSSTAR